MADTINLMLMYKDAFLLPRILDQQAHHTVVLYHYTDSDGLRGIIKDGKVWATHLSFMNDPGELVIAREVLTRRWQGMCKINPDSTRSLILKQAIDLVQESKDIYGFCLSREGDLLSQWRGYAPSGGYSIGFDACTLREELIGESKEGNINCTYVPITYLSEVGVDKHVSQLTTELFEIVESHNPGLLDSELEPEIAGELAKFFHANGDRVVRAIKHDGYSEEDEERFTITGDYQGNLPCLKYRTKNGVLIPYVELKMGKEEPPEDDKKLPINKIIMGPGLDYKLAEKGLRLLLTSNGYDVGEGKGQVAIKRSKIQYRG